MKKILIVDDDPMVRDAFELALSHAYDVTTAENGEAGVQAATSQPPDLVFLDLKMPGIDGVETLRQLRANDVGCPVYIVTAFMPEFLDELADASREGLKFGLGQKPLTRAQIQSIANGNLNGGA